MKSGKHIPNFTIRERFKPLNLSSIYMYHPLQHWNTMNFYSARFSDQTAIICPRGTTIFIYCTLVSTRWQWSLHLYTKGKNSNICREKQWETTEHKTESKTHKIQNENKKDNNNLNGLKRNIKVLRFFYNEDGTRSVWRGTLNLTYD